MAQVKVTVSEVVIRLSPWEKILTYTGDIKLARESIRGATEDPTFMSENLVVRTRGAIGVPGLFAYGVFAKRGDRIFSCWKRSQNVLVIELEGHKWNRIALGTDRARVLAQEIHSNIAT